MNTIVIGIAGLLLLFSSFVSLIFLLKRNPKQCKTSPLCVLVTSDIFITIFISILLFFNWYKEITLRGSEGSTKNGIIEVLKKINATNEGGDATVDCDLQIILLHYALFLIPFGNSFISLLSISIQYNCDVEIFHKKCKNSRIFDDSNQPKKVGFMNFIERRNTFTIVSVAGQWIIPILSTMMLLLAGHERTVDIKSADLTCVFTTKFPFGNCYFSTNDHDIESSNSTRHLLVDKTNYTDELALERLHPDSPASDQVVSKVYGIVELALQVSGMELQKPDGSMELSNLTSLMKIPEGQKDEDEVKPFHDSMKNLSHHYVTDISTEMLILTTSTENPSISWKTPTHAASDVQIFKDIVQKIHSNKFNAEKKVKPKFLSKKSLYKDKGDQIMIFEENIGGKNLTFPDISCIKDQCFISTNFLKIHLFLLMIFIYFGPILLSTILIIRSHYMCSIAFERLAISDRMAPSISFSESAVSGPNKPSKFGWFGPRHEHSKEGETPNDETQVESSVIREGEYFHSMRGEAEEIKKLSRTLKTSLITGVVSWSPMFLQVLMKVFLCSDLPIWLIYFFYLGAISSGVLRNYLNLKMLRSSEALNGFKKKNTVQPTPGLSTS